jgi:AcrR family transcriptional regulator
MQKKGNKKEQQRLSSIDRIMKCALELFVTNGYRATTVDMIGSRAKLTKGAIYFHFKNKEAILLRLLDDAEAIVVDSAVALVADGNISALDKFVAFLNQQSNVALSHPQHLLLLILMSVEFYGTKAEIEVRVRSIYLRLYSHIDGIIHQGQAEGSIRTDIRSHELTAVVMAEHDGTLIEWYRRPGELDGKNLARVARLTLLDGLKTRS